MAWLMFAAALACFAMAIALPLNTALVLLLLVAALVLLVAGATRRLSDRGGARPRSAAQMLDGAEMQRLRESAAALGEADAPR